MTLSNAEVLAVWLQCSGTGLTTAQKEIFLARAEVRELASFPSRYFEELEQV